MGKRGGIWIDHHKAVVVLADDDGQTIEHVFSDSEASRRVPNAFTKNDFVAEDKLERKGTASLNKYYDEVITHLRDVETLGVIGPGEAKGEFVKRLGKARYTGAIVHVETADKMTDLQIAARFRQVLAKKV